MRKAFSWGLLALASAIQARAEDVTEEEFLAALNESHAAVRALGEDLARAEAARRRAGTLGNPRLEFWREQPDDNPRVTNWTLSWTPPLDGRYGLGKKAADAGVAAARERARPRPGGPAARGARAPSPRGAWLSSGARLLSRQLERMQCLGGAERQRARVGEESGLSARRFTLAEAEVRAALRRGGSGAGPGRGARPAPGGPTWRPRRSPASRRSPSCRPKPSSAGSLPSCGPWQHEAEQAALENKRAGRFSASRRCSSVAATRRGRRRRSGPIFAAGWTIPLFDRRPGRASRSRAPRGDRGRAARAGTGPRRPRRSQGGAAAYRVALRRVARGAARRPRRATA